MAIAQVIRSAAWPWLSRSRSVGPLILSLNLVLRYSGPLLPGGRVAGQYLQVSRSGESVQASEYVRANVNGVPVVSTPAEIDVTTADQLRAVLIEAANDEGPVIVVDMSRTQFCDSAGLNTVVRAHKRVVAEGRELRVVIAADGAVPRIFALTGMDRYLRCFASLEQALTQPGNASAVTGGTSGPDQDQAAS